MTAATRQRIRIEVDRTARGRVAREHTIEQETRRVDWILRHRKYEKPGTCKNGHALTAENIVMKGEWPWCRQCNREAVARYRLRQKGVNAPRLTSRYASEEERRAAKRAQWRAYNQRRREKAANSEKTG